MGGSVERRARGPLHELAALNHKPQTLGTHGRGIHSTSLRRIRTMDRNRKIKPAWRRVRGPGDKTAHRAGTTGRGVQAPGSSVGSLRRRPTFNEHCRQRLLVGHSARSHEAHDGVCLRLARQTRRRCMRREPREMEDDCALHCNQPHRRRAPLPSCPPATGAAWEQDCLTKYAFSPIAGPRATGMLPAASEQQQP